MRANNIEMHNEGLEPEDHFGALLLLSAWLAEQHVDVLLDTLLAQHLCPWSGRYLELLTGNADHPLYLALAKLARVTLTHWQRECALDVPMLELYF
jgi:TorA maturation chaperone TorD